MRNSTKKIFHRTLSGFLAILTVFTLLATLSMLPVMAAEPEITESSLKFNATWYNNYYTKSDFKERETKFLSEEARFLAMDDGLTKGDFELRVDPITGEVALKDKTTGDILFTTPYDTAEDNRLSADRKIELLSQVIISFSSNSGSSSTYNSFQHAALLNQISIRKVKGGVRVEYSIGEEESRILVPMAITATRFREMIEAPLLEAFPDTEDVTTPYSKLTAFYGLYNEYSSKLEEYPVLKEKNLYLLHGNTNGREKKQLESIIRRYCPDYTFEELDKDHKEAGYKGTAIPPANFKMALEYYITDVGLEVRFPANGLTFDESNYQLTDITLLKYMGAGPSNYKGYTFFPDGSGALVRFEDLTSYYNRGGAVYGQDYAYQEIGNANQEVFRMPVFGVVTTNEKREGIATIPGNATKAHSTGYLAVVTEGDALASIFTNHEGDSKFMYNSAYCKLAPRPQDQYNLAEAISISGSDTFTVVSDRKYTDSFRINYIMLTGAQGSNANRTYYDASYVGMAKAYRDFLQKKGDITRLETVNEDIPLYVEAFGVTETDETVLSIPVTVKKALTSFDNLKAMTEELANAKSPITNVNYRLTGFTNGGMKPTIPSKVKFERVTGGNAGFRDFLTYAAEKGIGVYPDFDFVYMTETAAFDGFSYKTDAVKTIDDRYTTKRTYDAVLQSFATTGKICISPSIYRGLYDRFNKAFTSLLEDKITFVSAGTLGSELNSDFDEDDPYNREDAKKFTAETLERLKKQYGGVMVDSGNAYTIPYASVVLNAPLDSSRYLGAGEAVPFFGMTFHGYVVLAGKPTNMAGDMSYELLKIIENGATLYMMLSYDNVEILKEDEDLSKYYAIRYEIWREKLLTTYDEYGNVVSVGLYDKLNSALADVQTALINDHLFVDCKRKLTDTEAANIEEDAKRQRAEKLAEYEERLKDANQKKAVYDRIAASYPDLAERNEVLENYGINIDTVNADITRYTELCAKEKTDAKLEEYKSNILSTINLEVNDGSVVYVEYDNGHWFLLNYNNYDVEVLCYKLDSAGDRIMAVDSGVNLVVNIDGVDIIVQKNEAGEYIKDSFGNIVVGNGTNYVIVDDPKSADHRTVMSKLEIETKTFFDSNTDKSISYK